MATAAVQHAPGHTFDQPVGSSYQTNKPQKHDVDTELYYYKEAEDGSPPAPSYVGYDYLSPRKTRAILIHSCSKPETYIRPHVAQDVVVHDIAGEEDKVAPSCH